MALPFLPPSEIRPIFQKLKSDAHGAGLKRFVDYIGSTWVESSVWAPTSWSIYNDCTNQQGCQWLVHSFHNQASGRWKLPLYVLIGLLYWEALLTVVDIRLVSDRKLRRVQRKKYREMQAKLFVHWDEYQQGKKSALQLLRWMNQELIKWNQLGNRLQSEVVVYKAPCAHRIQCALCRGTNKIRRTRPWGLKYLFLLDTGHLATRITLQPHQKRWTKTPLEHKNGSLQKNRRIQCYSRKMDSLIGTTYTVFLGK